jgi:hypothetical protein
MNDEITERMPETEGERFTEPAADRPPTPEEEAAADRVRATVDIDRVAEHYEEMTEKGKSVKGEGDIFPDD